MSFASRKALGLITVCLGICTLLPGCPLSGTAGLFVSGDFLDTGETSSFFTAIQVDPRSEDSAGPAFSAAADLNGDGLIDLVSAWNQSQPVQIHLQGRSALGTVTFETITLAGSIPAVSVAGLAVADFDQDGHPDIAVLVKESLLDNAACLNSEAPGDGLRGIILLYMGPADPTQANQALAWDEIPIDVSFLSGTGTQVSSPEVDGYTAMAIGDMDNDFDTDVVVAWNSACGDGGQEVVIFTNNGPAKVRDGLWSAEVIPDTTPKGDSIKDVALADIDLDGDLDVVATFPTAPTMNVRWYRNPTIDNPDDFHIVDGQWQVGLVGQIATGADVIEIGDINRDGISDVVVRSTAGGLIQWLRGPEGPTTSPLRAIPWQVYTMAEFTERKPEAIALGDLDRDGRLELIASAEGGLAWFSPLGTADVYDQWVEHLIIDDQPGGLSDLIPTATDPSVDPTTVGSGGTTIGSIDMVDLDGDGSTDIVVTLDRSGLSGLTNDALVWFRSDR